MSPREHERNEEEEQQHQGNADELETTTRSRRGSNKNKKVKLFQDSDLTDSDRRMIRQNQRNILNTLRTNEYSDYTDIEEIRQTNNEVFQTSVCYTREAVLDADNVDLIAMKYAKQMEKQIQVPRYDAMKLVQKLKSKCYTNAAMDWKFLGVEAGICYNAIPDRVTFLAGVIDNQVIVKQRTVRQARVKNTSTEEVVEVKPENVQNKNNKGDGMQLSAMEKAMRLVRKKLELRRDEELAKNPQVPVPDIDLVQFLFHPKSFTQTVENIFNFSFLVKKGEAEIGVRPPSTTIMTDRSSSSSTNRTVSGAYVAHRKFNSKGDGTNNDEDMIIDENEDTIEPDKKGTMTQAVCRFTMADWRRICAKQSNAYKTNGAQCYGVGKNVTTNDGFVQCDLPERRGSGITKHASQ